MIAGDPFLSVFTRVNQRPQALYRNVTSLADQSAPDYEQIFLHDGQSRGIAWANERLRWEGFRARGKYVMVLDDDDLALPGLIDEVSFAAMTNEWPDMIIWRMDHGAAGLLPDEQVWNNWPIHGRIGMSCWAVRRDVWAASTRFWIEAESGDYHWLKEVWPTLKSIYWLDKTLTACQSGRSWGDTE